MESTRLTILAAGHDSLTADFIRRWQKYQHTLPLHVEWADTTHAALERMITGRFDAAFVYFRPDDFQNRDALDELHDVGSCAPTIVFSPVENLDLALRVVGEGAHDFLSPERMTPEELTRSLLFMLQRSQAHRERHAMLFKDPATGLETRAFFLTVAERELLLARRNEVYHTLILYTAGDIPSIAAQSDLQPHFLNAIARELKQGFRSTDLLARFDDKSFVVLAVRSGSDGPQAIRDRVGDRLKALLPVGNIGIAVFDPNDPATLDELFATARGDLDRDREGRAETQTPESRKIAFQKLIGDAFDRFVSVR